MMAEPFAKPTKKDIEKLMKLAEDNVFFWAMASGVKALESLGKEEDRIVYLQDFYRSCRLMLLNFPAIEVYEQLDKAVEDIANESYENLKVPDLEEIESYQDPFSVAIAKELKITDVAKKFGLKVKGRKCVCPFHDDKDPSLTFSDKKGWFNCFGCGTSGDIVTFYQKMRELKKEGGKL